jgi:hypothetical protein
MTNSKRRDKDLPAGYPSDWPQNLEEFEKILKSDSFVAYCEDRGLELRFDDKTRKVFVKKTERYGQ